MRAETKPREKEYIIDVPLALRCSGAGLGWPARAITELRTGSLVQDDVRRPPQCRSLHLRCHSSFARTFELQVPLRSYPVKLAIGVTALFTPRHC